MGVSQRLIHRGDAEARSFLLLSFLFVSCCLSSTVVAQKASQPQVSSVVPITQEPSHHLVFENEYVRVFKVEVAPHAETLYHKHDVDYVFVTLGDSDVESVRVGEPPVRLQLKDGETRFTKGGFAHKAVNKSDKPFVNVTVEVLKPELTKEPSAKCDCVAPPGQACGCGGGIGVGFAADGMGWWRHGTSQGRIRMIEYGIQALSQINPRQHGTREFPMEKSRAVFVAETDMAIKRRGEGEQELRMGDVRWIEPDTEYIAINRGDSPIKFSLIEFPK